MRLLDAKEVAEILQVNLQRVLRTHTPGHPAEHKNRTEANPFRGDAFDAVD